MLLTAQGGSTVHGLPNMSGPSPAQAAQRNYLQALHAEVAGKGVYPVWEMPTVDPEYLAGLLWTMHSTRGQREVIYP